MPLIHEPLYSTLFPVILDGLPRCWCRRAHAEPRLVPPQAGGA